VRWEQMQVGLKVADWSDLMMVGELVWKEELMRWLIGWHEIGCRVPDPEKYLTVSSVGPEKEPHRPT
jgi:hypothetical protein